jgi:hypothetical protein
LVPAPQRMKRPAAAPSSWLTKASETVKNIPSKHAEDDAVEVVDGTPDDRHSGNTKHVAKDKHPSLSYPECT